MQSIAIVQTLTHLRRPPQPRGEKLKSERVQEEMSTLPGWRLVEDGKVVQRTLRFSSDRAAAIFAAFLSAYAGDVSQPVHLELSGRKLLVKLFAPPSSHGHFTDLDKSVFGFARQLN